MFLESGKTYIEKDYEGFPTGSAYKYIGLVERINGEMEHEFKCIEFDCEDEFQHYSSETSEDSFKDWFYKQNA